jgi:translation initiation factor 3 subunit J
MRLANSVMESDLENARALVGGLDIAASEAITPLKNIQTLEPKTRAEFEDYVKLVAQKFSSFESSVSYSFFVESLVREMVVALSLDDTRKISSSLTAMVNEKQKALKESQGKGKKKASNKRSLATAPRGVDLTNYEDGNNLLM